MDVHKEKFHDSNVKDLTQATCLCGICDPEEIGTKASTEHTKNNALFDGPMLSTRSNGEILPCSVLSMEVYNYIGEVESADVIELPKLSHSVESRVHKQQRKKEENGNDQEVKDEEESSGDNEN